ncbi:uncharacterized protein LOC134278072 [Saccostrea cucullata]|uniref:uncharacterized protein LOC134278072 n=1 Tax=Saccostrea cuccullata TaxID=36930 RepID=UPI002ED30EE0
MSSNAGKAKASKGGRVNNSRNKRTEESSPEESAERSIAEEKEKEKEKVESIENGLKNVQKTLQGISKKLPKYEHVESELTRITSLIEDHETGLTTSLKYVAEQSESNSDELYFVRSENAHLRRELDLMRAMMIHMDRRMQNMESEITDLRSRSMRDNIMIHNLAYASDEKLDQQVPNMLKEYLGVEVKFVRIDRNSVRGTINSRPVSITGKLVDGRKKDELLRAQKQKKAENVELPFYITAEEPASTLEERKRLHEISDSFRKQNIKCKIEKGRVVMSNGHRYEDPIPKLEIADALKIGPEETATLDNVNIVYTEPTRVKNSEIFATGRKIHAIEEVNELHKKVSIDPVSAEADHRILVYRFIDNSGKLQESYWDGGEHGAGRRLLKNMQSNEIVNVGIVVTRWNGRTFLGQERFRIMEEHVSDIANQVDVD